MHSLAIKAREGTEHRRGKTKKKKTQEKMNRSEKQKACPRLLLQ
jgi:hypothetical protein